MTKRNFILTFILFILALPTFAGEDDIMITRDGSMTPVRIVKMSASEVTYVNLDQKKRGNLHAPTDFVYMIMKEKGNNIFFDEEGNQTTSPAIEIDKKDNVMFLNSGKMFVVYEISVGKNEVSYKLKDKKKEPFKTIPKSDLFMIRNSDGTTTLYNDSYQERKKAKLEEEKARKKDESEKRKAAILQQQSQVSQNVTSNLTVNGQSQNANNALSAQTAVNNEASTSPATGSSTDNLLKNEERIDFFNNINPEYIGGKESEESGRLLCIMGLTHESQLINNDIDIWPMIGRVSINSNARGNLEKVISERIPGTLDFVDKVINSGTMTNPAFAFTITNKSNKTIYIDLGNTFIIRGSNATAFYVPTSTSSSTSSSSGAGVNLGAVAGALGIGGTVGKLANGVNVGGSSSSGTVNTTYSQRVIAIPPMSSKMLEPQPIFTSTGTWHDGLFVESCAGRVYGGWVPEFSFRHKKQNDYYMNGETHEYEPATSPMQYSFFITYSNSEGFEQSQNARVSMYLRKIIGFPKPSFMDTGGTAKWEVRFSKNFNNFENALYFAGYIAEGSKRYIQTCFPR